MVRDSYKLTNGAHVLGVGACFNEGWQSLVIATVLKTVVWKRTGGSNPSPSAKLAHSVMVAPETLNLLV